MKKNILALILAFAASAAMAAQPDATDSSHRYEISITKGDAVLMSGAISAVMGIGASLSSTTEKPYVKSCAEPVVAVSGMPPPIGGPSPTQYTVEKLTSGETVSLARENIASSEMVAVKWRIDRLDGMEKSRSGQCEIDVPAMAHFDGSSQVKLAVGQSVFLGGFGADGYKVALKRTR